jgi:tetratricopeptide (TPR) repeat protein
MDSKSTSNTLEKLKGHKLQLGVALGAIALIAGVSGLTMSHGQKDAHGHSKTGLGAQVSNLWHVYGHAFISVQEKIDDLKRADEENINLRQENAHLRLVIEGEHYQKYAEKAQKETQTFQWKLSKETGSRTGRTIASIGYKIPQDLLPAQLFSLGMSYFNLHENEKAAVIFTFLTGMEGDESFKTPSNYLLTGIAWYRLENFELADFYFDQVLHSVETQATRRFQGQARVWKGLVAERTGKHDKAQHWLRDVLDHDPHSIEARWVNQKFDEAQEAQESSEAPEHAVREPAAEKPEKPEKPHEEAHEAKHE